MKVKEEGKVLDVKSDHIVFGVQDVFTKSLVGLYPTATEKQEVYKGTILTTGSLDVREYKEIVGDLEAQKYIIRETKAVYAAQ